VAVQSRKMAGLDVSVIINGVRIGGQVDAELIREALVIDTTSKDTGEYSTAITRTKKWTVECSGFTLTNDTGYELLLDAYDNNSPLDIEIKHKTYIDFYYKGQAVITDFPETYNSKDAVRYTLSLLGVSKLMRHKITEE